MARLYEVRVTTTDGESRIVPDVIEYVAGFAFFFCALAGSRQPISFPRQDIALVERRLPGQPWLRVSLKQVPRPRS